MDFSGLIAGVASNVLWDSIKLAWSSLSRRERIIYNGLHSISLGDVSGYGSVRYDTNGQAYGKPGEGSCNVTNGVIHVTRINTAGRLEVRLERLRQGRDVVQTLEPAPHLSRRTLNFTFQAKTAPGEHVLCTVIYNPENGAWLGHHKQSVNSADWRTCRFAIPFNPIFPARIRLDDEDVSSPSTIQIRRLVVTERPD